MKRIFITRRLPPIAKELLGKHFQVDSSEENAPLPLVKLKEITSNYDGILTTVSEKMTADILNNSSVQVISNYAVGLDNIDLAAAQSKGISIYNTPNVVTESTADLTLALLLAWTRKIHSARDFIYQDKWKSWDPELFLGEELSGKTLGIIGFGKIGRAVAKRALGFGLQVIYYNRSTPPADEPIPVAIQQVELPFLLNNADYISLHLPLTKETKHFIGKKEFLQMQKKPVLINMASGGVVHTDDLVEALQKGFIRGACLDVTDPEPLPARHPLCKKDNCLIIPHIGTATKECRSMMARRAAENIIDHFKDSVK